MIEPTTAKCRFCQDVITLTPVRISWCKCRSIGLDVGVLELTRFLGPENMLNVETSLPLFPDYKPGR